MKRASILSLLVVTLAACSGGDYAASESESASADASTSDVVTTTSSASEANVAPEQVLTRTAVISAADTVAFGAPETVPGVAAVSLNPMLVRTGQAVLQVDSLDAGITRVRGLARRVGGLVGNTTISAGTEETRRAQMELRIPSVNFDDAVGHLAEIGKVESVNVTAEDVGEEYTDVSARVANARQTEARLLELMNTREGRLDEVLNLEREVARVRGEIEQFEGRLRYLRSRSSVSLLTVTLHEPQTVMGSPSGERPIRDAFVTAWYSFVRLLAGLISSLGVLIPLGVLAYLGWRMFRRVQRHDEERSAIYRETLRRARAQNAEKAPAAAPRVDADAEIEEPAGRM